MADDRYESVKRIYLAALDLEGDERRRFVDQAVGEDAELRGEVEALLGYVEDPRLQDREVQQESARLVTAAAQQADDRVESVGGHRVLKQLGVGGMGTVFLAEQDTPRRTVAIKVLRHILTDPSARRRFEVEAELLGRLQSASIAQVFESGNDERHGPFIVMEYIDGQPVDGWAREVDDRKAFLEIWARIADGVQHAHQRGIIHRDLKPGNILVDGEGQPKILDFGIARAFGEERTTESKTRMGEIVGTLSFLSPEQASGDPNLVDTRSDVWALGVIGYLCLLGRLPHELDNLSFAEGIGLILNAEIERPSRLDASVDGDLETILMTALARDRDRRYQTAAELAADIRRFLASEPISAHPPSAWYLVRKFAGRHSLAVATAMTSAALLVVATIATLFYALEADRESERATRESDRAKNEARRANEKADLAERAQYRATLRAATAAVEGGRRDEALQLLEGAPEDRRGWEWHHLLARLDTCEWLFGDDVDVLGHVAFTRDGRLIVGHVDGRLRIVSPGSLDADTVLDVGTSMTSFDASAVADEVCVGHRDGRVVIWDMTSREPVESKQLSSGPIGQIRTSPSGRKVLCSQGKQAWVWHRDRANIVPAQGFADAAWRMDDSHWLDHRGKFHAAETGHASGSLKPDEVVTSVALSPDGREAVFGSTHPSVRIVDIEEEKTTQYWRGTSRKMRSVAWTPDGECVISGDDSGTLQVWQHDLDVPLAVLLGHDEPITDIEVSPDGLLIAAATASRVRVWRNIALEGVAVGRGHESYVYRAAFSPDGRMLASAGWDGTLRLWDGQSLEPIGILAQGVPGPTALAWSPDGRRVHLRGHGRRSFDVATGENVAQDQDRPPISSDVIWPGRLHNRFIAGPRHMYRARTSKRRVDVLDLNGEVLRMFETREKVGRLAVSRDETLLAIAGRGGIEILSLPDGRPVTYLDGHATRVTAVRFNTLGTRLASGGADRTVRIWETSTWDEVATLRGHIGDVRAVLFSPDDGRLASVSADRTVRLWSSRPRHRHVRDVETARRSRERRREELGEVDVETTDHELLRLLIETRPVPQPAAPHIELTAPPSTGFGAAVAATENGPGGRKAVLVGSPSAPPGQTGAVELRAIPDGAVLWRTSGAGRSSRFGAAAAVLGDVDGDGIGDFAVGAPGEDAVAEDTGAIHVLSGRDGKVVRSVTGPEAHAAWGLEVLTLDDVDGDGLRDLAIGTAGDALLLSCADLKIIRRWPCERGRHLRQALVAVDDRDGDGRRDLMLASLRRDGIRIVSSSTGETLDFTDFETTGRIVGAVALLRDGEPDGFSFRTKFKPEVPLGDVGIRGRERDAWFGKIKKARNGELYIGVDDVDGDGSTDIAAGVGGRARDAIDMAGSIRILSGRTGVEIGRIDGPPGCSSFGTRLTLTPEFLIIGSPNANPPRVTLVPRSSLSDD